MVGSGREIRFRLRRCDSDRWIIFGIDRNVRLLKSLPDDQNLIAAFCQKGATRRIRITLRGKVLSVGGIKEKVMAAHRANIKTYETGMLR